MPAKVRLCQITLPASAGLSFEQAGDEDAIRRYIATRRHTLPGDIEIDVAFALNGGWLVSVFEQPNLPDEPNLAEPV